MARNRVPPRHPLPGLWFQPDAPGRVLQWPTGLKLWRLPPPLCTGQGLSSRRPGPAVKSQAIAMYIEGSSLIVIGRVLGYSAPAVLE